MVGITPAKRPKNRSLLVRLPNSGEGATLNNLGERARVQGRAEEAARYYEQALAIRREVGNRRGEGITLNNLGLLASDLGRPEEAARYYEQALAIVEDIGAVDIARTVRENLEGVRVPPPPAEPSDAAPQPQETALAAEPPPPVAAVLLKRRHWRPFGR